MELEEGFEVESLVDPVLLVDVPIESDGMISVSPEDVSLLHTYCPWVLTLAFWHVLGWSVVVDGVIF